MGQNSSPEQHLKDEAHVTEADGRKVSRGETIKPPLKSLGEGFFLFLVVLEVLVVVALPGI